MSADAVQATANGNNKAFRDAGGLHPGRPRLPSRLRHVGRTADAPAPFPCLQLCLQCGYLTDPPASGGYRNDATPPPPSNCPSCGCAAWLDLRRSETLAVLAEGDAFASESRESALVRWSSWGATLASIVVVGGSLLAALTYVAYRFLTYSLAFPFALTVVVTLLAVPVLAKQLAGNIKPPLAKQRPARWRHALAHAKTPTLPSAATVEPTGPLLIAPLSGEPCLGYEIGVRTDADDDAPAGTWLLLEQRVARMRIGTTIVPANGAWLDLPRRTRVLEAEGDERRARILRERGFTTHDNLELYETIVLAGAAIQARVDGNRIALSVR